MTADTPVRRRRLAIIAHYDPRVAVAPHVMRTIEALVGNFDRVVVVTTSGVGDAAQPLAARGVEVRERANEGQDFGSWNAVLESLDYAGDFDELLLTNDTYIGFLRPLDAIIAEMSTRELDVWGITESLRFEQHIQSYFLYFTEPALRAPAFIEFWNSLEHAKDRMQAIMTQEVGISHALRAAGLRIGAYFSPTLPERRRANRRGIRRLRLRHAAHPKVFPTIADGDFTPRTARNAASADLLNAAIVYADSALDDGRLPVVKIDTLRYDSSWLGTEQLLGACEQRFPDAFADVRRYLLETDPYYPTRPTDNRASATLGPWSRIRVGFATSHVRKPTNR